MLENKVLVLRLSGEIFIKSDYTRHFFEEKLKENIKTTLKNNSLKIQRITKDRGLFFVEGNEKQLRKATRILPFVFGLHSIALTECFTFSSLNEIADKAAAYAMQFLKPKDSFAVITNRTGKHEFNSMEVNRIVGKKVMDSIKDLTVNLTKPKKRLFIEIHENKCFLFNKEIKCNDGIPVGVEGNTALLIEGKKFELVSGFLLLRKGCRIFPLISKNCKHNEKKLRIHLKPLIKWNSFREFIFTKEKDLKTLIKEKNIKAIISSNTNATDLKEINALNKKFNAFKTPVFMPLLFFNKKKLKEMHEMIVN